MIDGPIDAIAVVVPAHDEEQQVEACLDSIRTALERLPSTVASTVTVVLDRCTDTTPERVAARIVDWPAATALRVVAAGGRRAIRTVAPSGPARILAGSGVGAVRDVGIRSALDRLRPLPPRSVWLLHTDADTVVPPDWALAHLDHAGTGTVGVAGTVELSDGLSAWAARRHDRLAFALTDGGAHRHVYGANLGVRADAYLAVGGFPTDGPGEDHGLWQALSAAGYRLSTPTVLRVLTSSRLAGRASGGLADLLRDLHDAPDDRVPPAG